MRRVSPNKLVEQYLVFTEGQARRAHADQP